MKKIKGLGISSGIAIGKAFVWETPSFQEVESTIDKTSIKRDIKRLNEAISTTEAQIEKLQQTFEKEVGHQYADIFSFHLALLKDKLFKNEIERIIKEERITSESAVRKVIHRIGKIFKKDEKDFLQDRRRDIMDVMKESSITFGLFYATKPVPDRYVARDLSPVKRSLLIRNISGVYHRNRQCHIPCGNHCQSVGDSCCYCRRKSDNGYKSKDTVIIDGDGRDYNKTVKKIIAEYKKKKKNCP